MKKWNVYLMSLGSIIVDKAKVDASRIGLCSNEIRIINSSNVTASSRGCAADKGWGNLPRRTGCSGSGASHGGDGGSGSQSIHRQFYDKKCVEESEKPGLYYEGREARLEGSGGTSGDSTERIPDEPDGTGRRSPWKDRRMGPGKHGGPGGGIIWLTTPNNLLIKQSNINVNGGDGYVIDFDEDGSGGGSGGSI